MFKLQRVVPGVRTPGLTMELLQLVIVSGLGRREDLPTVE
jgi:hypothetical protein